MYDPDPEHYEYDDDEFKNYPHEYNEYGYPKQFKFDWDAWESWLLQAMKDIAHQDFLRQQNYPLEMIGAHASVLHGVPRTSQEMSYQQAPATPQLNVLGQLGNLAGNIYAARMGHR